jgi:hypothetical protein
MKYKCRKCGDIIEEKKLYHKMQWCSCHSLGVDWITGSELFRVLGNKEDYETMTDKEERLTKRVACCPDSSLEIFANGIYSEWRCKGCGGRWVIRREPGRSKHTDEEYHIMEMELAEAQNRLTIVKAQLEEWIPACKDPEDPCEHNKPWMCKICPYRGKEAKQ